MKNRTETLLKDFKNRYPMLDLNSILAAIEVIQTSYSNGNKLLVCGNGGSASDAIHIVGELMKSFTLPRTLSSQLQSEITKRYPDQSNYLISHLEQPLEAISLVNETSLITAYSNDKAPDLVFAQQVLGHGKKNDVLVAISTSGNSKNIIHALQIAKVLGLRTVGLTGKTGGKMKDMVDVCIHTPSTITHEIQEYHLPIYHLICLVLESEFFP